VKHLLRNWKYLECKRFTTTKTRDNEEFTCEMMQHQVDDGAMFQHKEKISGPTSPRTEAKHTGAFDYQMNNMAYSWLIV
jgi:hypothetical protein